MSKLFFIFIFIALTVLFSTSSCKPLQEPKQTYIVHMNHKAKPPSFTTHQDWYSSSLLSLTSSKTNAENSLLYTYNQAFHGFAASLTPQQANTLRMSHAVFDVYEDSVYQLHTTRTPEFLGIEREFGLWDGDGQGMQGVKSSSSVYDVIVGVLDTGVWPESLSFNDVGMSDVPKRWRGKCEDASDFSSHLCNKKLIGARSFSKGFEMARSASELAKEDQPVSPRDYEGHGTHTASTAAGARVANASLLGYASGIARGMAAHARVATYKVCWPTGCFGSDILAGMEQAIADGVDVLSLSLGGGSAPYYRDTVAIGAFSAMAKGIFVSCSAGNSGPTKSSLANVAPWIMTVGAGTLDRDFPAYAVLGNKKRFAGVSLYSGAGMGGRLVELVYKGANSSSNLCLPGSLDKSVKGKVVLCDRGSNARVEKGVVVRDAGGIGMILANTAESGEELVADSHLLPAVSVGRKIGDEIREYVKKEAKPMALLRFSGTMLNIKPSPVVAAFSSRGPNMVNPQILKPDVIGPGVNILAAWSEAVGPTGLVTDTRKTKFNILSGTSMSCPHISGLAALLKAAHPDWSPSAIKSALMTTAYTVDNTKSALRDAADGSISTPYAHGAGHVDPQKALSPGLIYDISTEQYIMFLCSLGYSVEHLQAITKQPNVTCENKYADPGELNYPSFSVVFGGKRVVRYSRTLTNVGAAKVAYRVNVTAPDSVSVKVRPRLLTFRSVGEKKTYKVSFAAKKGVKVTAKSQFGSIVWENAHTQVTSPVAFSWRYFF